MAKSFRIFLTALIASSFVIFTTGCPRKQEPTPSDTGPLGGSASNSARSGLDTIVPPSGPGDNWGLTERDGSLTGPNTWNGKEMAEGILPDVYFGFDSSAITASERPKLRDAADYLMENPSAGILIEGHCDWYGTAEYNLALGDRRATSVADYLATLGVSPDRIETLSKGSLEATSGLSKAQAQEDRKAELIILR